MVVGNASGYGVEREVGFIFVVGGFLRNFRFVYVCLSIGVMAVSFLFSCIILWFFFGF